jgi:glycosyltransferase involved in cell wall biosynthesis
VAVHELALARVLAGDLERVHPDWRLTVLVLDGDRVDGEPFETVAVAAVDPPDRALLEVVTRGPGTLAAALRPSLMAWLARRSGGPVAWLDPTVRLFEALDPLAGPARDGVALVPLHPRFEPARGLTARGPFESGIVAASDVAALEWWAGLVGEEARRSGERFDPLAGHALAALTAASDGVRIVRDRSLCAGWWTLAAGGRIDGSPPALDGERLRAFNAAGFDPARPHWLSTEAGAGAARISDSPALAALLAAHARETVDAGWEPDCEAWRYATLPGEVALDDDLRHLFALAAREGADLGDPFEAVGAAAFLDWIDGESPVGAGVSWYLERVHRRRADLQVAFPDLAGGDGARLVQWMETHGVREEPVLAKLIERRPLSRRDEVARRATAPSGTAGVRIVGYLGDGLGIGEAARSYARSLAAAGMDVETVEVPAPMERRAASGGGTANRRRVAWEGTPRRDAAAPGAEIVCVNPPELLRLHRAGMERPPGVHRIGVWAWELDTIPPDWEQAYPLVDEIWVYSEHVASALRDAPVPVSVVPLSIDLGRLGSPAARSADASPFTFLFVFDLLSSVERKNPLGLIEAYHSAFAPGEGARLVLKTSNGDNRPEQLERIRVAALGRPDIEVIDEFLPVERRDALIAGCDCYVSLHRAEGFGLTIAEAMAAGRPAIATGWSGNLGFMTAETSHLVGWRPALVEAGSELYPAGARWAEPDLDEAAALMRQVRDDPEAARLLGEAGCRHVCELLAPAIVGARARDRLEEIARATPSRRPGRVRAALARRGGRT